ncbi:MAG: outer membrane protein assembly factor BamB family protein [Acidimicrobiales bacterium]
MAIGLLATGCGSTGQAASGDRPGLPTIEAQAGASSADGRPPTPPRAERAGEEESRPAGSPADSEPGGGKPALVWEWEAPGGANLGTPVVDSAGVVFAHGLSAVSALDLDGKARWEVERTGVRDVAPALAGSLVLMPADDGMVGISRSDGTLLWDRVTGERSSVPWVSEGLAVTTTWEGSLMAFDVTSGEVAWRIALGGPSLAAPIGSQGVAVAIWDRAERGQAAAVGVEAATGRQLWSTPLHSGAVGAPGLVQGPAGDWVVVVVDGDVAAHGLDLRTGRKLGTRPTSGAGSPQLEPAGVGEGHLLVPHRLGGMALLDGAGNIDWALDSETSIAVRGRPVGPTAGGRFLLALDEGVIMLARNGILDNFLDPPGRVSGLAVAGDLLLIAGRESQTNYLWAVTGW